MKGTIDKRPDRPKKWRARYRGPDGRAHTKAFQRKVDAEKWLAAEVARLDRGEWIDPKAGNVTFASVAERWLKRPNIRESTRQQNADYMRSMILPRLGDRPVKSIRPADLDELVAELMQEDKAPKTVRKAYSLTGQVFKLAVRDELIARSPARNVALPPDTRRDPIYIDAPDILKVSQALEEWRGIGLLAGFGGLRFNEVAGLQAGDVEGSVVHVARGAADVRGRVVVGPPKTAAAIRGVAIPDFVVDSLPLDGRESTDFVYINNVGGPLRRRNWMRRVWRPAIATVDVPPDLNFHDLRHSHVAVLIKLGEHPKTIADRLGHKSVRTVLDIYGGLFDEVSADVAKKLSALADVSHTGPIPDFATTGNSI